MRFDSRQLSCCIAGLWAGAILAIGAIAAPAAFATAASEVAGQTAAAMFAREAYGGLVLGVLLLALAWHRGADGDRTARRLNILLVAGTMLCTLGYFALQPAMTAARAGQGVLTFAALHGISASLFLLKGLLALVLTWRLAAARRGDP